MEMNLESYFDCNPTDAEYDNFILNVCESEKSSNKFIKYNLKTLFKNKGYIKGKKGKSVQLRAFLMYLYFTRNNNDNNNNDNNSENNKIPHKTENDIQDVKGDVTEEETEEEESDYDSDESEEDQIVRENDLIKKKQFVSEEEKKLFTRDDFFKTKEYLFLKKINKLPTWVKDLEDHNYTVEPYWKGNHTNLISVIRMNSELRELYS